MPKAGNSSKPKVTHPLAAAGSGTEAVRLRVRIPKSYHQEPVITTLAQRYPLTVNIRAALLGANGQEDGWFDLELHGPRQQTEAACQYLANLGLELWYESILDEW